jgi:hypothetical protein
MVGRRPYTAIVYARPLGLFVYLMPTRNLGPGTHETFIAPLWK